MLLKPKQASLGSAAAAWCATALLTACQAPVAPTSQTTAIYDRQGQQLPDSAASSSQVDWQTLTPAVPDYLRWNGVGTLTPGCTATLLQRAGREEAPAYLVTAGHCVLERGDDPETILVDTPTSARASLGRYVAGRGSPEPVKVTLDRVLYATMKGTDLAILRVGGTTYAQLLARRVQPLALAAAPVQVGEALLMPHTPLEGVSPAGLRLSRCSAGEIVDLREDGHNYYGAFRNRCSSVGGTSGAPVIAAGSGEIIGILTTGTRQLTEGQADCVDSRPCEVQADQTGVTLPGENYAQNVVALAACFDAAGDFDLASAACRLEKPSGG